MATNGASTLAVDDPVLQEALSGMDTDAPMESIGDPATGDASQGDSGSGAASPASDPPAPTGDGGSGPGKDAAPATVTPGDDPLAGTEAFTYGEGKTLEGVYRVPGEGLLVPEAHVGVITSLAERAEQLDRVVREYESQNERYERLSRWTTTGEDGTEQVYEGATGIAQMRIAHSALEASFNTMLRAFADPAVFASLVSVDQQTGQITPDRQALQYLLKDAELAETKAAEQTRAALDRSFQTPEPAAARSSPDYSAQAPAVIDAALKQSGLDAKHLTPEDRTFLAGQLPRYIRDVTAADRRFDPTLKLGAKIVDAEFTALVKQYGGLRVTSAQTAKAAEQAGKFNAGQDKGRQPAKPAPAPSPAPATPPERDPRKKADWDSPLANALAEMAVPR